MRLVVPVLLVLSVSACETGGLPGYVTSLPPQAGARAAEDIASFVQQNTRPDGGPIAVSEPAGDNVVGPALINNLQMVGYRIGAGQGAHSLRYAVTMLGNDILLRATIDTTAAARLYQVVGPDMRAAGPFTITEGDE